MKPTQFEKLLFVRSVCRTERNRESVTAAGSEEDCHRDDCAAIEVAVGSAVQTTSFSLRQAKLTEVGPTSARQVNAKLQEVEQTSASKTGRGGAPSHVNVGCFYTKVRKP